jgi:hypothetical protein
VVWGGVELGGGGSGREVWSSQQQLRPSRMTMCCVSMRQAAISPDFPRFQTSLVPTTQPHLASLGAVETRQMSTVSKYRDTVCLSLIYNPKYRTQTAWPPMIRREAASSQSESPPGLAILATPVTHVPWYPDLEPSRQATCLRCASHRRAKPYTTVFPD